LWQNTKSKEQNNFVTGPNQFIADFILEHQPQEDQATLPLDFFSDAEPRL